MELLKQQILLNKFLLSINEQDTSYKSFLLNAIVAGNLIPVTDYTENN